MPVLLRLVGQLSRLRPEDGDDGSIHGADAGATTSAWLWLLLLTAVAVITTRGRPGRGGRPDALERRRDRASATMSTPIIADEGGTQ